MNILLLSMPDSFKHMPTVAIRMAKRRGEGEVTFRELTRALDGRCDMHFISGLSHRCGDKWIHNQQRAPHRLER